MEAALQKSKKPYKLIPVRFVEEGGTKMGHTVIMNWDAKVLESYFFAWNFFPARTIPSTRSTAQHKEFVASSPSFAVVETRVDVGLQAGNPLC